MKIVGTGSGERTTRELVGAGAELLAGEKLEAALAIMQRLAGASYDLRSDSIELGTNLVGTRLYFPGSDSVASVFEALGFVPEGRVQLLCADSRAVYEMPSERFVAIYDEHLRPRLFDYMIKDSTNSWCVVINHSGGVMFAKGSGS